MPGIISQEEWQASSIHKENRGSVFEILSQIGYGSGFLWDEEGYVVTNLHVIQNAPDIEVRFNGKTYYAKPVGSCPDRDVAVLRVEELKGKVKPLSIDVSGELFVGQRVFAIGNPYGLRQSLDMGFISGLCRGDISASSGQPVEDLIQTNVVINSGCSGGPLLNSAGYVIGITTSVCSASGVWSGVGFSISIRSVRGIIDQMVRYGKVLKPNLGIKVTSVSVLDESDGPAANAVGLQRTELDDLDFVIRRACGDIVRGTGLHSYLHLCEAGDQVTVTVEELCGGRKKKSSVTLHVSETNVMLYR